MVCEQQPGRSVVFLRDRVHVPLSDNESNNSMEKSHEFFKALMNVQLV